MGPDRRKQFLNKNPSLVPTDEDVKGVLIVEPKGGAWRRGIAASSTAGDVAMSMGKDQPATSNDGGDGDIAAWPGSKLVWLVLTDKQLHAFEGRPNSQEAGPGAAHYPLERIRSMRLEKKLLISKLHIEFTDGKALELDVSKQKTQDFVDSMSGMFGS
jgi:hypothetical protein